MSDTQRLTRVEQQVRTRAALLEAGGRVFVARGFAGASVEAIAAEAGFTRGAFYANFGSKEALFAALLQERVYAVYSRMAEGFLAGTDRSSPRQIGERLATVQADPDGKWMFRLWLELLAHADRDPALGELAKGFWAGNRALLTEILQRESTARGIELPASARDLATAQIAMDIGLALQHHVDPEAVPLSVYGAVWAAVFGPLDPR